RDPPAALAACILDRQSHVRAPAPHTLRSRLCQRRKGPKCFQPLCILYCPSNQPLPEQGQIRPSGIMGV
ncbi:hypothetical protein C8R44DRAFT_897146, partial [Mycena epipterygia]